MSDKFDAAIQDIAIKHGVVLSKDDPILILQTMNDRLIEETRQAQAAMLAQFREEMESISSQWKDDAKEKAEKVLNSALAANKVVMDKLLQEATKGFIKILEKVISDQLVEARNLMLQTRKFSQFSFLSSAAILAVSFVFASLVSFGT